MNYITNYSATSYSGAFEVTTSGYKFAGTVTCDKDNNIKSITSDVTKVDGGSKVGIVSLYFSDTEYNTQEAVSALIDAVVRDLHSDLASV